MFEIKEHKAKLISRYILDSGPYAHDRYKETWKECSLRAWLNHEFYEQSKLNQYPLIEMERQGCIDHVALCNVKEVKEELDQKFFKADVTPYAKIAHNGALDVHHGRAIYWLEDHGMKGTTAAYMGYNGHYYSVGTYNFYNYIGIRPIITLEI